MNKKGMVWKEVIGALLAAALIFLLFYNYGPPMARGLREVAESLNLIKPKPVAPDTYNICDRDKTVTLMMTAPNLDDPNDVFTYGWNANDFEIDVDSIRITLSDPVDTGIPLNSFYTVYKDGMMIGTPASEDDWKELGTGTSGSANPRLIVVNDLPDGNILINFDDIQISNGKRICKSQRQIAFKVKT